MSLADISAVAGQENADMVVVFVPSYSCWVQEHTGAVKIKRYDFSFFPPSLRWVLSDLLVASLFHFSAPRIISPASWKAAVAMFLRTSSQPVRKLSQRRWFVLPRMVRASCTSRSWLVGRRGSSHEHKEFHQQWHQRCAAGAWSLLLSHAHTALAQSSLPAEQSCAGFSWHFPPSLKGGAPDCFLTNTGCLPFVNPGRQNEKGTPH